MEHILFTNDDLNMVAEIITVSVNSEEAFIHYKDPKAFPELWRLYDLFEWARSHKQNLIQAFDEYADVLVFSIPTKESVHIYAVDSTKVSRVETRIIEDALQLFENNLKPFISIVGSSAYMDKPGTRYIISGKLRRLVEQFVDIVIQFCKTFSDFFFSFERSQPKSFIAWN